MVPMRFDHLTSALGATATRRAALTALLSSGLAGALGFAETAAMNGNKKRRKKRSKSKKRTRRRANRNQSAPCGVNQVRVGRRCVACDVCQPPGACRFDSVAQAVAGTPAGGTVRVCPGAYRTVDVLIDKELGLIGAGTGVAGTTLDAEGTGRVIRTSTGGDGPVRIEQLTITGGSFSGLGGGLSLANTDDVTLVGVLVTGNAAIDGAGIGSSGALRLENSHVTANTASDNGGGILIDSGGTLILGVGTRVSGNGAGNDGGGVYNRGEAKLLDGSLVSGNDARDDGGGIENRPGAKLTLEAGSRVSGNTAGDDGGGINNRGEATLRPDSRVADNEAGAGGGGISNSGTLTLEAGSRVTGNDAATGGGIFNNTGTVTNDGDVSGNTPNQCAGNPAVPNCPN